MAHLTLDDLQPEPHVVTFRGAEYRLPGAVPIQTMLQGIKLDEEIDQLQVRARETEEALTSAIEEHGLDSPETIEAGEAHLAAQEDPRWQASNVAYYELVMDLFRDSNPDVPDLRLTARDCGYILAMIRTGVAGVTMPEAAAEELGLAPEAETSPNGSEAASGPPTSSQAAPNRAARRAKPAKSGSRSAKRSPARSSASG